MDAAFRGSIAFAERGLDPEQARGESAAGESGSPLARARQSRDVEDIKDVDDFGPASVNERLAFLGVLLAQHWVGPLDEAAIERIWAAFGPRVIEVASRHRALWDASIERAAELDELPAVEATRAKFRADVCLLAHEILRRNEAHVLAEMQRLGVGEDAAVAPDVAEAEAEADLGADAGPEADVETDLDAGPDEHLAHLQWCAYELLAARQALGELGRVPVGYAPIASEFGVDWVPAMFDPAQPPPLGHDADVSFRVSRMPGTHGTGEMRPWDEVRAHHDRLQAAITTLAGESPALYAAAAQNDNVRLGDMARRLRMRPGRPWPRACASCSRTSG